MKLTEPESFSLSNFEGPLDLLWQLINRQELDIYEVSLYQVIQQFLSKNVLSNPDIDQGAEFISLTSSLLWLKSKTLLPQHEQQQDSSQEEESDSRFEIIHHLIDYCRFRQAAKDLAEREHQQSAFYIRGVDNDIEAKKNLGIDHLSLDDLAALFQQILAKATSKKGVIHEEEWKVSDIISSLKNLLKELKTLPFESIFTPEKSRIELIVTFLALLELMKNGEARVVLDRSRQSITIIATS